MILKNKQEISWQEPINLAQKIAYSSCGGNWCFLYSGLNDQIANSKSYIALFPQEEIVGDDFAVFEDNLKENCRYFGYFSYGLKNDLENLPQDEDFLINLPNLWLMNFAAILEFDHDSKKLIQFCAPNYEEKLSKIINSVLRANDFSVKIENLQSNFSKEEYLQKVKRVQEHIVDVIFIRPI
jgi:anthranilate/para-aminobenzoate synthase component I